MESKPFGVNLKRTGADPVHDKGFASSSSSTSSSLSSARKTSYTPLKPANVQDLKAMFDDKKGGTASSSGGSSPRSAGGVSPRSGTTSPRSGSSSPGFGIKKSESVTSSSSSSRGLTSKSSASLTRGTSLDNKTTSSSRLTSCSSTGASKFSVSGSNIAASSRDNAFPSRINITTTTTTTTSSKNGSRSSVGRAWSPKSQETTKAGQGSRGAGLKSVEKEKRVEIPVQHVTLKKTTSGPFDNKHKSATFDTSSSPSPYRISGKGTKVTLVKTVKDSGVVPEKKTGTSSSSLTSSKCSTEQNGASSKVGARAGMREIPVQRLPSDSNKTDKGGRGSTAAQSKLTGSDRLRTSGEKKSTSSGALSTPDVPDPRMLSLRKMSNERFERLKFDFERGVPTEMEDWKQSEIRDHLELQLKARDLQKDKVEEEEVKTPKEESIFAKGMKVSDFVKHINTVHPPSHPDSTNAKKFKVGGPRTQRQTSESQQTSGSTGSAGSDPGGENEYIEMPEDAAADDADGIYEFVGEGEGSGERTKEKSASLKTPGRRHGVYRKEKGKRASLKRKKEQSAAEKETAASNDDLNNEEVVISSGEDDWSSDSSGTDYEPVGEDNLYEDPDALDLRGDGGKGKKDKDSPQGRGPGEATGGQQSLGKQLKKNVDKATNYLNKITKFNKKKGPKDGSGIQISGAGTDSEADVLDDEDGASDASPLSRSSSQRSSGRLTKSKDKELSVDIPKMQQQQQQQHQQQQQGGEKEAEGGAPQSPPPPLPPRASKVLKEMAVENSPPLPPRNTHLTVSLDQVVPITPPARGQTSSNRKKSDRFSFGKDSYLGGQEMHSGNSVDAPDYEVGKSAPYMDFDPASPRNQEKLERKDKTSGSQGPRTSSGSYLYPDNISDWPQLQGDSSDEDLYIELEDDQIYGRTDRTYSTKFESEPLYQWYAKDHIMRCNRQLSASDMSGSGEDTDESVAGDKVYESVERLLKRASTRMAPSESFDRNAPARRSVIMDVFGKSGSLHRALWSEMPEVIKCGILRTMDPQEKKVQESMFEIMTSEASYLKSLNVLINVFLMAPEFSSDMSDRCVVTKRERQFLFSNIGCIRDLSAKFLADLEVRWQESCILNDVCDIISKHAEKNFEPYIRYCSNQAFQERALETLMKRPEFSETVLRLGQNPDCQFLPMSSFLLLPMQRITRLPLLVDAVRHRLDRDSRRYESASRALDKLNRVVKKCNDGAKSMLQTEQMCLLAANLEFTKVKEFPLVSSSRHLVKQGELTKIVTEGTSRIPFGRRSKEHIYLYLFNDIVLVTKKRGNVYQVRDYCQRNSLHTEAIDSTEKSKLLPQGASGIKNLFHLVLLSNHEGKQVELILSAKSESERTRWLDAILPQQQAPEYERIYEEWDCPQVQCVEKYIAQEPDELSMEESDVINVYKKMLDGWYEGERIRDGERGWFPADHTEEINNSHVRARNLRLRYRLMIASQEYTDMKFGN